MAINESKLMVHGAWCMDSQTTEGHSLTFRHRKISELGKSKVEIFFSSSLSTKIARRMPGGWEIM